MPEFYAKENKMEEWQKGNIAICVKDDAFDWQINFQRDNLPVRLNCEYIVNGSYTCPRCNNILLDIGIGLKGYMDPKRNGQHCKCGEIMPCKEIHWINSKRFKKRIVPLKVDIMLD